MGKVIEIAKNNDGVFERAENTLGSREVHSIVTSIKASIVRNFIRLGAYLKLMHDKELYKEEDCERWTDYLNLPEVDLSRSQACKLMAVYDRWVNQYGHSPEELIGISVEKLYIASSQATIETEEDWLEKARVLSRDDLKKETGGSVQKKPYIYCPKCEHLIEIEKDLIVYR